MSGIFFNLKKLILKFILIALIFSVTFQFIDLQTNEISSVISHPVFSHIQTANKGIIVIELINNAQPQVIVTVNGKRKVDFKNNIVELRLNSGDQVIIDCSDHSTPLWFEIKYASPKFKNIQTGDFLRSKKNKIYIYPTTESKSNL